MQQNPFTKEYTEQLLRKEARRLYAKKGRAEKMLAFRRLGYSYREIGTQFPPLSPQRVRQILEWYMCTYKVKKTDLNMLVSNRQMRFAKNPLAR